MWHRYDHAIIDQELGYARKMGLNCVRVFLQSLVYHHDPLLELGPTQCPRRETLAAFVGIEPRDAGSWREFIGRLFDRIAA
jgi:hypothetical protein